MSTMKVWDAINGSQGRCYAKINGDIEEMLYVKNIEAKVEKEKSEVRVLGYLGAKHKATGWKGSGSMTVYYATTKFRELMLSYMKSGKDAYFDLVIENKDDGSDIGAQRVILKQVNLDSILLAKLDVDNTELDEEIDFTFNDAEILESFSTLVGE